MKSCGFLIFFLLVGVYCQNAEELEFNLVFPTNDLVESVLVNVIPQPGASVESFQLTTSQATINATHQYVYTATNGVSNELAYNYQVNYKNGTTVTESFWRELAECRLIHDPSATLKKTKNEFFNQVENELGLPKIPFFSGVTVIPPSYYDDNQVMTVSFQISQQDLNAVIFNPGDSGDIYVKANLTMVSLEDAQVYENMKIRRAGSSSLGQKPYSYQIKLPVPGAAGVSTVIKFKAFPYDYIWSTNSIIAEKAASDVCYAVGAPINFVSYVRLFINSEFQGMYGMVEKVDENFIAKRWPFIPSGDAVGDLYKIDGFSILDTVGFQPDFNTFVDQQTAVNDTCCPCIENGCEISFDECFIYEDEICQTLLCCECTWDTNGKVTTESSNCAEQQPYYEFNTLGNAVIAQDLEAINAILDAEEYVRSLLCSLAVMNPDGYIYNSKNYYWYRDTVSGKFQLILYDQDTCFQTSSYNQNWNPYDWPLQGDLTDALILPTLFNLNSTLVSFYNELATNFLTQYYRADVTGPMYERMDIYSDFISKYNTGRKDVLTSTESAQLYFIKPLSELLHAQFSVPPSNPPTSTYSPVCSAQAEPVLLNSKN